MCFLRGKALTLMVHILRWCISRLIRVRQPHSGGPASRIANVLLIIIIIIITITDDNSVYVSKTLYRRFKRLRCQEFNKVRKTLFD